jgi:cell wall-associated NlpC family hydrolase
MLRAMPTLRMPRFPRAKAALGGGALSLAALTAGAAPDASQDTVGELLAERGLVTLSTAPPSSAEPGFVRQARDRASDMVVTALNFLDVPYRRGGNSAVQGFDCSGFTRHIFEMSLGLLLPRRVDEQASAPGLSSVKRDELQPGDLVFFNTLKRTFSHVGIYIGAGKFIHAPRPGGDVRVEDMRLAYWAGRFTGARRAEAAALKTDTSSGGSPINISASASH